ncbi:MAG: FtsX-like permease family protein [Bryobacterales bacterium]|nr:FtsX-like permease family protein [Bryobacterales bacterium]
MAGWQSAGGLKTRPPSWDPDLPVSSVMSMAEVIRAARWPHRVFGSLFGILGLAAAALAGLGVYSVMARSVAMRAHEIGLRMALGATGADIRGMVLARGVRQVALGLLIGFAGARAVTRALGSLLVGVSPSDPATYCAMGAFQAALALAACWLPARRAARVDPLETLRRP